MPSSCSPTRSAHRRDHPPADLDEEKPEGVINEAKSQVAFADRLLLNKTDTVTTDDLERIESRIRTINGHAPIERCMHSQVSVDHVLNIHGFDLPRALKAKPDLLDAGAAMTKHDKSVTSVSLDQSAPRHMRLVKSGALDLDEVQKWIGEIIRKDGNDVFRMKGILNIAHAEQRFVYHAVHMLFSGAFDELWDDGEARVSKMVFIGKNLDAKALAARFNACLVTPENIQKKKESLRFDIGDRVECNAGEWLTGTIVALFYRDDNMPQGMVAPYQIRVDADGGLIWAPKDHDAVIRMIVDEQPVRTHDHCDTPTSDEDSSSNVPKGGTRTVTQMLTTLGLAQHIAAFEEEGMEMAVLMRLTKSADGQRAVDEALKDVGVKKIGDRLKIFDALQSVSADAAGANAHSHDHDVVIS